jgi:hypothetical protein
MMIPHQSLCSTYRIFFSMIPACLAAAIVGCGSDLNLAPVEGMVTFQGKPLANATVTFIPKGEGSLGVGITDEEGSFSILTGGQAGVTPGMCAVTVSKMESSGGGQAALEKMSEADRQKMMMSGKMQGVMNGTPKSAIPAQYGNAMTSGLSFEVMKDGENNFPITLQ